MDEASASAFSHLVFSIWVYTDNPFCVNLPDAARYYPLEIE